jgi:uncharacterized SAM-binding protein YcdF (DUF218 family)
MLLAGSWGFVAWDILRYGNQMSDATADAAVVLGAAAWGSKPSPAYRERIVEAVALYRSRKIRWIILTGGTSRAGYPSEADVGRQFCVSQGVPAAATLVDEQSRTTWQNLLGAKALMDAHGIRTVLLVSDPLHMRRAMAMARDIGLQAQPAATPSTRFKSWITRGKFLWRETWLYLAYVVFGLAV